MEPTLPPDLAALLDGHDSASRHAAWAGFLSRYHRLLFKTAASFGGGYDERMDRFQHMVDALAADDYRRLRSYRPQPRSSFPAWLSVVARRLCVDFDRQQSGRADRGSAASREARQARRRLHDLAAATSDPDTLPDAADDPAERLERAERRAAVERALDRLPPRDRLLLRLRYDDDVPVRDIRDLLGFPTVFHVYRHLRALVDRLRQELSDLGPDR